MLNGILSIIVFVHFQPEYNKISKLFFFLNYEHKFNND